MANRVTHPLPPLLGPLAGRCRNGPIPSWSGRDLTCHGLDPFSFSWSSPGSGDVELVRRKPIDMGVRAGEVLLLARPADVEALDVDELDVCHAAKRDAKPGLRDG